MQKIIAGDPETRSPDIVADNLAKLQAIFPDAFTEGKVDFEVLRQLVGDAVEERDEKYGLNWYGKRRARQLALTPSIGTLRPCPEDSVDWETTQNLMIEGDNLEVLKLLRKSYAGKVNLIYIDPPYNTGKEFVYPDNYRDGIRHYLTITGQRDGRKNVLSSNAETSGRFHTTWLNMIYPRLRVARDLLSNDGAIAVSIDEHEFYNIRHVLNSTFGEENLVATICASLNPKGRQLGQFFATSHEYIVIYAKNIDGCVVDASSADLIAKSDFPLLDDRGNYRLLPLRNTNKKFTPQNRPNLYYPLYVHESTGVVSSVSGRGVQVYPVFGDGSAAVWRWSTEKVREQGNELYGRIVQGRLGDRWDVFQKDYLFRGRTKKLRTVWQASEVGSTDTAATEVKDLLGLVFASPKPTRLIRRLIRMLPPDSLIVDFFAGSGTTGHAVVAQNAEDRGTRRYVCVQLPQPLDPKNRAQRAASERCDRIGRPRTIAELTKERLRRAGRNIAEDDPMFASDLGFRVFKLDTSNIRTWDPAPDDLNGALLAGLDHIEPGRTEQDILYELLLKLGLDLCVPMETRTIAGKSVHSIGAGTLIACLDEAIAREDVEELALAIADWHDALGPAGESTIVFRDSAFVDDVAKTNLAAILEQHGLRNIRSL